MEKSFEERYRALENSHWWFQARRDMILKLAAPADDLLIRPPPPKGGGFLAEEQSLCNSALPPPAKDKRYPRRISHENAKILDIGCSGGALLAFLKSKGFRNIYGADTSQDAVNLCKERGLIDVFLIEDEKLPFQDNQFDVIIASDVLEHIENDGNTLKEWRRVLKHDGKLIIFVPAFDFLWSEHDEANKHYRRYSRAGLMARVESAGLETQRLSYWNSCLFLPALLLKRFRKKSDQLQPVHPIINALLFNLLRAENTILTKIDLPLGVSLFAVARKNQ